MGPMRDHFVNQKFAVVFFDHTGECEQLRSWNKVNTYFRLQQAHDNKTCNLNQ